MIDLHGLLVVVSLGIAMIIVMAVWTYREERKEERKEENDD